VLKKRHKLKKDLSPDHTSDLINDGKSASTQNKSALAPEIDLNQIKSLEAPQWMLKAIIKSPC